MGDLPPTGNKVKYSRVEISRIVDEKVIESWIYFNQATQMTQLGYTITPPE
jgi:predicted ester cyclase